MFSLTGFVLPHHSVRCLVFVNQQTRVMCARAHASLGAVMDQAANDSTKPGNHSRTSNATTSSKHWRSAAGNRAHCQILKISVRSLRMKPQNYSLSGIEITAPGHSGEGCARELKTSAEKSRAPEQKPLGRIDVAGAAPSGAVR